MTPNMIAQDNVLDSAPTDVVSTIDIQPTLIETPTILSPIPLIAPGMTAQNNTPESTPIDMVSTITGQPAPIETPTIPSPISVAVTSAQMSESNTIPATETPSVTESPDSGLAELSEKEPIPLHSQILHGNGCISERTVNSEPPVLLKIEDDLLACIKIMEGSHASSSVPVSGVRQVSSKIKPLHVLELSRKFPVPHSKNDESGVNTVEGEMIGDSEEFSSRTLHTTKISTNLDIRDSHNQPHAGIRQWSIVNSGGEPPITTAIKLQNYSDHSKRLRGESESTNDDFLAPKRRKKDIEQLKAELAALEKEEAQSILDLEEARQKQRLQKAHREVS